MIQNQTGTDQNIQQTSQKIQWTDSKNLQAAQKLKKEGNAFFTQKSLKQALKKYHQAILHLDGIIDKDSVVAMYSKTATHQISDEKASLKFSIWLNMSQIYIFQQKYERGLQILKKAENLLQKKLNDQDKKKYLPKLFYRKGICYMKSNYLDEARKHFLKLKQIDQSFTKQIQGLQKQIQDRQKQVEIKEKKLYQGFFK